jgi:hypothetical protein
MSEKFENVRRQHFIDEESYKNTLIKMKDAKEEFHNRLNDSNITPDGILTSVGMIASYELWIFQLKFTGGASLKELSESLGDIVKAYEVYANELRNSPNIYEEAVFNIDHSLDDYVDYLNLLSAIILLRRIDLLERAAALLAGTPVDHQDVIVENLLKFFLSDRPSLDQGYWGDPYQLLMDAIEADSKQESAFCMKKFVKKWYPSMKGDASFWGKHEHIKPEFSAYRGYWDMSSAAFSYLLTLDDSSYRKEIVYPYQLVDYARSFPKDAGAKEVQLVQLKIVAGNPCTRMGFWFTPARPNSRSMFREGEVMPVVSNSDYGLTIWQFSSDQ